MSSPCFSQALMYLVIPNEGILGRFFKWLILIGKHSLEHLCVCLDLCVPCLISTHLHACGSVSVMYTGGPGQPQIDSCALIKKATTTATLSHPQPADLRPCSSCSAS